MDIEIERFRNKYDNETEWNIKKNFLLTHANSLPIDQLECLTNCYANVKLYGCKYAEGVMEKLELLGATIPQQERVETDKKSSKDNEQGNNYRRLKKLNQKMLNQKQKIDREKSAEVVEIETKFKKLRQIINLNELKFSSHRNKIEILTMSCDKARMSISLSVGQECDKHICTVFVDHVFLATGKSTNKKSAKMLAFTEAINSIQMHFHDIVMIESKYKLMASNEFTKLHNTQLSHQINKANKQRSNSDKKPAENLDFLSEFVIREFQYSKAEHVNFVSQLQTAASFNQVNAKYDLSDRNGGMCICVLTLNGVKISEGRNANRTIAKAKAAEAGLNFLRKRCYTIIFKQRMDAESGNAVERDQLLGNDFKNNSLPTSNLGNQLLRKLGWTGGGVGKTQGISEPIFLEGVLNREGLGLSSERGLDPNFASKVTSSIIAYMHSDEQDDLVFSPDFTKEERSVIHLISKKYHLVTKSYGPDGERFLVLSRKRTPMELVKHIKIHNGETHKYLLLRPG